jgi:hypothetical protein
VTRWRGSVAIATCLALRSASAQAEPEWTSAVVAGVAGVGHDSAWDATRFYGALRGDALFLRTNRHAFGLGPAVEVATVGFSDVRLIGSATVLCPIGEFLAVTLSPGGFVRSSSQGAVGGFSGRAFFGVRAYGYTDYALNGGLLVGFDRDLGGPSQSAVVVGAQVDGLVLALPVLFIISALHGSKD